jgi:calcineurin-like phosphoesterase family protein
MGNVFFIADLHLGHQSTRFWRKPDSLGGDSFESSDEHDEYLIDHWNAKITKRDTVYVLGDAVWSAKNYAKLERLHGAKKLVMGNHDMLGTAGYIAPGRFTKLYGAVEYEQCILTHLPVHTSSVRPRYRFNIHGHIHAAPKISEAHICVSIEHIGYAPIAFEELVNES